MKKSSVLLILVSLFASGSVSCSTNIREDEEDIAPMDKIALALPSGAPTLSVYELINSGDAELITAASNISPFFSNGAYPFIAFDSTKGSSIIEQGGDNARYEFDRMLTGGNFHLFAFNKTETDYESLVIKDSDYIIGFQQGNTPDKLFKSIYEDVSTCDTYLDNISVLKEKLLTMRNDYTIDKVKVDYAIVAEPAATIIKGQLTKKGLKILDVNLQTEFKKKNGDKWTKDYIPQAGLFVRKDIKSNFPKYYEEITSKITNSIDNVLSCPKSVKEAIQSVFPTTEDQISHYGFASSVITSVQGENGTKNGFGIVSNEVKFSKEDIQTFNSLLN